MLKCNFFFIIAKSVKEGNKPWVIYDCVCRSPLLLLVVPWKLFVVFFSPRVKFQFVSRHDIRSKFPSDVYKGFHTQ